MPDIRKGESFTAAEERRQRRRENRNWGFRPLVEQRTKLHVDRFILPRTVRPRELITAADMNQWAEGSMASLAQRGATSIFLVDNSKVLEPFRVTPVEWQFAQFDRLGMFESDSQEVLTIPVEGLWLFGVEFLWTNANTGNAFILIEKGDGSNFISRAGPYTGTNLPEPMTVGAWYCYPGDTFRAQGYHTTSSAKSVLGSSSFWAVQLTGRRQRTTGLWTNPTTWSSGNKPTQTTVQNHLNDLKFLESPPHVMVHGVTHTNLPNNTLTDINFHYQTTASHRNFWSSSNQTRLTAQEGGLYLVGGSLGIEANATGVRTAQIRRNGTLNVEAHQGIGGSSITTGVPILGLVNMGVDDYIELRGFQNSGGTLQSTVLRHATPSFWACRVGSTTSTPTWTNPKLFELLETLTHTDLNTYLRDNLNFLHHPPSARLYDSTPPTFTNATWTKVGFDTTLWDTDSLVGSQQLNIQTDGLYLLGGVIGFDTSGAGKRLVRLTKNGAQLARNASYSSSSSIIQPVWTLDRLKAGDAIALEGFQNSGGNLAGINSNPSYPALWCIHLSF